MDRSRNFRDLDLKELGPFAARSKSTVSESRVLLWRTMSGACALVSSGCGVLGPLPLPLRLRLRLPLPPAPRSSAPRRRSIRATQRDIVAEYVTHSGDALTLRGKPVW